MVPFYFNLGVYELEIKNHTHMHENTFVSFQ